MERLRQDFLLVPHGVGMSPGSVQAAPDSYYAGVREVLAIIDAPVTAGLARPLDRLRDLGRS